MGPRISGRIIMADDDVSGLADGQAVVAAAELARTLDGVRRTARGIAGDLGTGLASAVVYGERLDAVLARAAERLTARLLDRALAPLAGIVAGGLSGLAGAAAAAVSPIAAAGAAGGFGGGSGGGGGGGGRRSAGVAGFGAGAGATGAGERAVQVTLNVTTPDVDGFRHSEAQVSAMLARAVGRGRRGM
jgi:hypothetical protein